MADNPMTLGQVAFFEGKAASENPYDVDSLPWRLWSSGWHMESALTTQDGPRGDPRDR